jgi:hypothetical protein
MVEYGFRHVCRRYGSKEERIEGLFEGRDIVDKLRYGFDVGIEPLLNDFNLIREVDRCRTEGWRV